MDKLNLSPQERRLVAGVGLVVFLVLNFLFVWPHFGDWRNIQSQREKADRTLKRYQTEVNKLPRYEAQLRELEKTGQSVVAEEQDLSFAALIQAYIAASRIEVTDNREAPPSSTTVTNQFFSEKSRRVGYRGDTEQLINFLTSLTSTNSLIRVRTMTIRPDPPNAPVRLSGEISLVASYQRKVPAAPAPGTPAAASTNTAARPTNAAAAATPRPTVKPAGATNKPAATATTTNAPGGKPKPIASTPPKS